MKRRLFEQILLGADGGLGRHHHLLANRIDRRIGHLREQLLEVVEEQRRLVREHRERSIGTHRADRLLPVGRHRGEDHFQILDSVAEGLLLLEQIERLIAVVRWRRGRRRQRVQIDEPVVQPAAIRLACGEALLDLLVLHDAPFDRIDEEHATRLQPPLERDLILGQIEHAGFRSHYDEAVLGYPVTRRAQAVAIEHRADAAAVGKRDRSGAIPRLHHGRMVLVEGALAIAHQRIVLPRLGNHHHRGMRERASRTNEQFEAIIEDRRSRYRWARQSAGSS